VYTNHMLTYHGTKFSKSKGHGPTIHDYCANRSETSLACLRVYLSKFDLARGPCDFVDSDFIKFEKIYSRLRETFLAAFRGMEENASLSLNLAEGRQRWIRRTASSRSGRGFDRSALVESYLRTLELIAEGCTELVGQALAGAKVVDPALHAEVMHGIFNKVG
jgi:hypothetical protein